MKELFSIVAAMALVVSAQAAAIVFNGEDSSGSGDLALDANWDGGVKPTSSQEARFALGGEVTSSETLQFGATTFANTTPLCFKIAGHPLKTAAVTLNADADVEFASGSSITNTSTFNLGARAKWTVSGVGSCWDTTADSSVYSSATYGGARIAVTDGAEARLYRGFVLQGPTNRLEIGAGSSLFHWYQGGGWHINYVGTGANGWGNVLDIAGTYSGLLNNADTLEFHVGEGAGCSNNVVRVRAGGTFAARGKWMIGENGSHNSFVATNAASVRHTSNNKDRVVHVGHNATACDNLMYLDSTNCTFAPPVYVGYAGSRNRCVVTNAQVFPFVAAYVGAQAGADDNELVIAGTNAYLGMNLKAVYFGAGARSTIRFEGLTIRGTKDTFFPTVDAAGSDGRLVFRNCHLISGNTGHINLTGGSAWVIDNSTWVHNGKAQDMGGSHSRMDCYAGSRAIFTNGSKVAFTNDSFAVSSRNTDNTALSAKVKLEFRDKAEVMFSALRVSNSDNLLVISNATVKSTTTLGIPFTTSFVYPQYSTNNVFRFEGRTPRLEVNGSLTFVETVQTLEDGAEDVWIGASKLAFVITPQGFDAAPVEATASVTLPSSTRIVVDEKSLASRPPRRSNWPIVKAGTGTISVSDLAALGSELPVGYRLILSDDKKTLFLSVPSSNQGLLLLVR